MTISETLVKIEYLAIHTMTKKEQTVCDGLAHGFLTNRFPAMFDKILQTWETNELLGVIQDIAQYWDGENYLSGVIWASNTYYNEVLKNLLPQ